jgi:hypothetical protein
MVIWLVNYFGEIMKISVDGVEVFELSETQKKVIQNDICCHSFAEDMKRRLQWILVDEKYQKCFERLKKHWEPILVTRYQSLPTNPDDLANLIFSQPDYKNRTVRDAEEKARIEAEAKENV